MIVGDYYINNALVAALLIAAVGGLGLATGAFDSLGPGGDQQASERDLEVSLEGSQVEAGSVATVEVSGPDGDPVSNAVVFVDGSEAGRTSDLGRFSFQAPNSSEVSLRISTGRTNVTETLQVQPVFSDGGEQNDNRSDQDSGGEENNTGGEGSGDNETGGNQTEGDNQTMPEPSVQLEVLSPSSGDIIESYAAEFNFSASTNVEASYRVVMDGSIIDRGSLEEGDNYVETDFAMSNEGRHTWSVEVDAGNQTFTSNDIDFMLEASDDGSGDEQENETVERVVPFSPSGSVSGYRAEFTFDVNSSGLEADSYSVLLDGSEKFSGSISSGLTSVSEEAVVHESGEHDWSVDLLSGGQTVYSSDTSSFSTSESSPPIDISLDSPGDGDSITGSEVTFNVSVNSPYDYRMVLFTDGEVRYNRTLYKEEEPNLIRRDMSGGGQHTWQVRAVAQETGESFSSSERSFSTSEGAGFATVDLIYPNDGASGDPGEQGVRFEWEVEAFEQVEYEMVVDGSVEFSSSLEEGMHEFSENLDLSQGQYTWFVRVSDGSSTVKSEERTLTVE